MTDTDALTSREMKAIEMNAEYLGVSKLQMMENAGAAVAREIAQRFSPNTTGVAVYAGIGGNGGDGFVAARHLAAMGFDVVVVLVGRPEEISNEAARTNWRALASMSESVKVEVAHDSSQIPELKADVLIDALLGTGAKGALRPPILQAVQTLNRAEGFKISVDVPTGVEPDTGAVGNTAFRADLTITFHREKRGLSEAGAYVGELKVAGIGVPREAESHVGPGDVFLARVLRATGSHKGDFGRLLVVGGSDVFSGAPALVALAALRTGVDLVYVAAPRETAHDISSIPPDLITLKLDGKHLNPSNLPQLREYVKRADAVVVGPGLGLHNETIEAVEALLDLAEESRKPLLLDADGLKAFAKLGKRLLVPLVFTPHTGEYQILTGERPPTALHEKVEHVRQRASKLDATILLKGHVDVISDGRRTKLNLTGNPGMTVGGTGDVLAGIIGGLMAQGIDTFTAAAAGAFVNGAAGDFVADDIGYHMTASDLIERIPRVIEDPMLHSRLRDQRL